MSTLNDRQMYLATHDIGGAETRLREHLRASWARLAASPDEVAANVIEVVFAESANYVEKVLRERDQDHRFVREELLKIAASCVHTCISQADTCAACRAESAFYTHDRKP